MKGGTAWRANIHAALRAVLFVGWVRDALPIILRELICPTGRPRLYQTLLRASRESSRYKTRTARVSRQMLWPSTRDESYRATRNTLRRFWIDESIDFSSSRSWVASLLFSSSSICFIARGRNNPTYWS